MTSSSNGTIILKLYRKKQMPEYGNREQIFINPESWLMTSVLLCKDKHTLSIEFALANGVLLQLGLNPKNLCSRGLQGTPDAFWSVMNPNDQVREVVNYSDNANLHIAGTFAKVSSESMADISLEEYCYTAIFKLAELSHLEQDIAALPNNENVHVTQLIPHQ